MSDPDLERARGWLAWFQIHHCHCYDTGRPCLGCVYGAIRAAVRAKGEEALKAPSAESDDHSAVQMGFVDGWESYRYWLREHVADVPEPR